MLFDMIDTDKSGTIEAGPVPTVPRPLPPARVATTRGSRVLLRRMF